MRMQTTDSQVRKKKSGVKAAKAAIRRMAQKHSGVVIPVKEIREEMGAKVRKSSSKKS